MIKLHELKEGDIIEVDFEGQRTVGDITDISTGDKKVKVAHGETEFWYDFHDCYAVALSDDQLTELGFSPTAAPDGRGSAWERGPFTVQFVPDAADAHALLHYRDETRHVHAPDIRFVHQLQNHYKGMTNFELSWP
jgi:hypothetical protein